MNGEQQELYDIVSDWWDDVFVVASFKGRDSCLIDLVNAIIEWKRQSTAMDALDKLYDENGNAMKRLADL
jgi:hypothetical protein